MGIALKLRTCAAAYKPCHFLVGSCKTARSSESHDLSTDIPSHGEVLQL